MIGVLQSKDWLCLDCQIQRTPKTAPSRPLPEAHRLSSAASPQKNKTPTGETRQSTQNPAEKKQSSDISTSQQIVQKQNPKEKQKTDDDGTSKPPKSEPSKDGSGFFGFGFGARSRSPSPQPAVSGKVLGFGSSLFSSASHLISSAVPDGTSPFTSPSASRKGSVASQSSDAVHKTPEVTRSNKTEQTDQGATARDAKPGSRVEEKGRSDVTVPKACPLCHADIQKEPANYKTCTGCERTVCNLCGFNPAPDKTEVRNYSS